MPKTSIVPTANSVVFVFPRRIIPASASRRTTVASASGTRSSIVREWHVVRTPRVNTMSLCEIGSPWSGPRQRPAEISRSAARAAATAASAQTVM